MGRVCEGSACITDYSLHFKLQLILNCIKGNLTRIRVKLKWKAIVSKPEYMSIYGIANASFNLSNAFCSSLAHFHTFTLFLLALLLSVDTGNSSDMVLAILVKF